MLSIVKLIVLIGFIFCNFDNNSAKTINRKKRDNEAILYGNQQGSPHKTIKKSGPLNSLESHMSNKVDKKSNASPFEIPVLYDSAKSVVKRAKRSLVQQSMETGMGSNPNSYGLLRRKKRYAEYNGPDSQETEFDPEKLEKIRQILSNQYDMFRSGGQAYNNDAEDSRMMVVPSRELIERLEDQVAPEIEPQQEVIPYEEEEEVPAAPQMDPRIQQLMLAEAIENEQQKRDEERRRRRKREQIRKRSSLRKRQEMEEPSLEEVENNLVTKGYQLVEINGIPGVFMPFTEADLEQAEAEREIERRMAAAEEEKEQRKRSDTGQLQILARMLAQNRK